MYFIFYFPIILGILSGSLLLQTGVEGSWGRFVFVICTFSKEMFRLASLAQHARWEKDTNILRKEKNAQCDRCGKDTQFSKDNKFLGI